MPFKLKFLGIIPARFASTRFPGKPLAVIDGKTMIMRVYEQACKASMLSKVAVATVGRLLPKTSDIIGLATENRPNEPVPRQ